jgi:uncharacterized damage-inducible protein DinB
MRPHDPSEFLAYYSGIRRRTDAVVRCIPPEHLDWGPGPGRFTLADIVRHLAATERFMYAENARGRPSRYPGHGRELADGHGAVLDYFARLHRESMEVFSNLTEAEFNGTCRTPAGAEMRVWKWLRAMVEHEVHHRGQLYVYLGLLGVPTPPIFGLTSEQVRAASLDETAPGEPGDGGPGRAAGGAAPGSRPSGE